jgi:hypothetical protein
MCAFCCYRAASGPCQLAALAAWRVLFHNFQACIFTVHPQDADIHRTAQTTDTQTDRHTDKQTDRQTHSYQTPALFKQQQQRLQRPDNAAAAPRSRQQPSQPQLQGLLPTCQVGHFTHSLFGAPTTRHRRRRPHHPATPSSPKHQQDRHTPAAPAPLGPGGSPWLGIVPSSSCCTCTPWPWGLTLAWHRPFIFLHTPVAHAVICRNVATSIMAADALHLRRQCRFRCCCCCCLDQDGQLLLMVADDVMT